MRIQIAPGIWIENENQVTSAEELLAFADIIKAIMKKTSLDDETVKPKRWSNRGISDDLLKEIKVLSKQGMSQKQISKRFNKSNSWAGGVMKRYAKRMKEL